LVHSSDIIGLTRYLYLNETFSSLQLVGAAVTLVAIYLVNFPEGND